MPLLFLLSSRSPLVVSLLWLFLVGACGACVVLVVLVVLSMRGLKELADVFVFTPSLLVEYFDSPVDKWMVPSNPSSHVCCWCCPPAVECLVEDESVVRWYVELSVILLLDSLEKLFSCVLIRCGGWI